MGMEMFSPSGTQTFHIKVERWNFFLSFKNGHYADNQVYFYESNSKKSAILVVHGACMHCKVFTFKNPRGL